jgi:hypothetical protein
VRSKPERRRSRIAQTAERVNDFIDRVRGVNVAECRTEAPAPYGHLPQLLRLHTALDQLEKLTADLSEIG